MPKGEARPGVQAAPPPFTLVWNPWPYGPALGGERLRAGLHLWPEIPAQPNGVTNLSG